MNSYFPMVDDWMDFPKNDDPSRTLLLVGVLRRFRGLLVLLRLSFVSVLLRRRNLLRRGWRKALTMALMVLLGILCVWVKILYVGGCRRAPLRQEKVTTLMQRIVRLWSMESLMRYFALQGYLEVISS